MSISVCLPQISTRHASFLSLLETSDARRVPASIIGRRGCWGLQPRLQGSPLPKMFAKLVALSSHPSSYSLWLDYLRSQNTPHKREAQSLGSHALLRGYALIHAPFVSPRFVKSMARVFTSSELNFALRTLDVCGRRGFYPWLRYGVWCAMARELRLPMDVEDLVASYI